jgi:uncharacterized repeat protein (TIGR01451 family)
MKKFLLANSLFLLTLLVNAQSLVGISPTIFVQGSASSLTATITGLGTGWNQSTSAPDMNLNNGTNFYYGDYWTTQVTSDTTFTTTIAISPTAPLGSYNLVVNYYDGPPWLNPNLINLNLPNAFTIVAPDGYAKGTVYEDKNQNGIQEAGEAGISGLSLQIQPGNIAVATNANGQYSYPLSNGNYSIQVHPSTLYSNYLFTIPSFQSPASIVINNANDTVDIPLYHGLTSIYPDSGFKGQVVEITVYSSKGIFRSGGVNLGGTRMFKSSGGTVTFNATKYTFIDSTLAKLKFTVSSNVNALGNYDLQVFCTSGYVGNHFLKNCFRVVNAPVLLSGRIYLDLDSNAIQGTGELGIQNQKILLTPDSTYAFSDNSGNYTVGTTPGTRKIEYIQGPNSFSLMTNNVGSYTQLVNTSTGGFNFGLKGPNPNYACDLQGLYGIPRCNTQTTWSIYLQNTGNIPYNGWVYLIKSSNVGYVSGTPAATFVTGDTIGWYLTNIQAFQTIVLHPLLSFPTAGQTVNFTAIMNSLSAVGAIQNADTLTTARLVSCSFDPNDKAVIPAGVDSLHYTLMSETLDYTVRFQNTGNDTAFVVVVRDTLDDDLDLTTFEMVAASHPVLTEVSLLTRVAKFTFNNILLADSNVNEDASHGFLRYKIKPKTGLPANTVITNTADIYFDFNAPVITNQTFNTMVYTLPTALSVINKSVSNITVKPNPFSDNALISFSNKLNQPYSLLIFSMDGQMIEKQSSNESSMQINSSKLNSGVYLFELINTISGEQSRGKLVISK